jgi:hypothetical protein
MGQFGWQKFQSNSSTQPLILGLINNSHTATAELLGDAVVGNCLVDEGVRH